MRKKEYTVTVAGTEVFVLRKKMKTLRLRVLPGGKAVLSASLRATEEDIAVFLRERSDWLRKAVEEQKDRGKPEEWNEGDRLMWFGKAYTVTLRKETDRRAEGLTFCGEQAVLSLREVGERERRQAAVEKAKREELNRILGERVPFWEEKTGLHAASWKIRDMSSRWGSCTVRDKTIRFSLKLSERSGEEIDCTVLHELCHLAVPNHGPAFASLMSRYLPEWKTVQKNMRG